MWSRKMAVQGLPCSSCATAWTSCWYVICLSACWGWGFGPPSFHLVFRYVRVKIYLSKLYTVRKLSSNSFSGYNYLRFFYFPKSSLCFYDRQMYADSSGVAPLSLFLKTCCFRLSCLREWRVRKPLVGLLLKSRGWSLIISFGQGAWNTTQSSTLNSRVLFFICRLYYSYVKRATPWVVPPNS